MLAGTNIIKTKGVVVKVVRDERVFAGEAAQSRGPITAKQIACN